MYDVSGHLSAKWRQFERMVQAKGLKGSHSPITKFSMKTKAGLSGIKVLVKRQGAGGCGAFHFEQLDTNVISKDASGFVALQSQSMVLFDAGVLTKGYQYKLEEDLDLTNSPIETKDFINDNAAKYFENVQVMSLSNTKVEVSGIDKSILADPKIQIDEGLLKKESFKVTCGRDRSVKNTISKEWIDANICSNLCRDGNISLLVNSGSVSLEIPIRKEKLRKLINP